MESNTEESDSEESDIGESAESAYEEQVIAHAPKTGRESIHTGRPQALLSARECRSQSAERRLSEEIERVSHYFDSSNLLQIYIKAVMIKHESKSVSHPMLTVTGVSINNTNNKIDEYLLI
jgi:hypothetical protein